MKLVKIKIIFWKNIFAIKNQFNGRLKLNAKLDIFFNWPNCKNLKFYIYFSLKDRFEIKMDMRKILKYQFLHHFFNRFDINLIVL